MKANKSMKGILLHASIITALSISLGSCGDVTNTKNDDAKVIAEEHNDAKYDNTSKEKDAQFLVNAAEINLSEIKLGILAQKNGSIKIVKQLGKLMEDMHQLSMAELTTLAQNKQITIPIIPTASADENYNKLMALKGKDFDKEYCDMMVNAHKSTISLYEKASTDSKDMDIKNWATTTLPNIRMHLDSSLNCQRMCEEMK
jgi:putative membrane protein